MVRFLRTILLVIGSALSLTSPIVAQIDECDAIAMGGSAEQRLNAWRSRLQSEETLDHQDLNAFLAESKACFGDADLRHLTNVLWVASYCYERGDLVQSSALLCAAKKSWKNNAHHPGDENDTVFQIMYYDLAGRLDISRRRVDKAITAFKKSSALRKDYYGRNSFEYVEGLLLTAESYTNFSKPNKAVHYHNQALAALSETIKEKFRQLDEAGRDRFWESVLPYFEGTMDAVFFSAQNRRQSRKVTRSAYDAILLSKSALLSASVLNEKYDYTRASEIAAVMNDEDVCVEFFRTHHGNYGALVLKKTEEPLIIRLDSEVPFAGRSVKLDDVLPYSPPLEVSDDFMYLHKAVGSAIWPDRLTRHFPRKGIGRVYYSTAGKLDLYPVDCLPSVTNDKGKDPFVGQIYDLSRLSSTREIVSHSQKDSLFSRVFLLGGVNYLADSSVVRSANTIVQNALENPQGYVRCRDKAYESQLLGGSVTRDSIYAPLPGSLLEICHVDSLLSGQTDILTGSYATKGAFEKIVSKSSLLVLSTHGYTDVGHASGDALQKEDPLERCGILLAGTDSSEDSQSRFLSARQIANMDMSHVQLAVLASCNSMGSTLQKDGVYGLMRAFKLAGVKSVLATMWPIGDEVTTLFLQSFFSSIIEEGKDIPAAFYESREKIRSKYVKEYYWSPFVLIDGLPR